MRTEILFKSVRLSSIIGKDNSSVICSCGSVLEGDDSCVSLVEFSLVTVKLELAKLIIKSVETSIHGINKSLSVVIAVDKNISYAVIESIAVFAVLRKDESSVLSRSKLLVATALSELLRKTEHLLHISHLSVCSACFNTCKTIAKSLLVSRVTVDNSTLNTVDAADDSLLVETTLNLSATVTIVTAAVVIVVHEKVLEYVIVSASVITPSAHSEEENQKPPSAHTAAHSEHVSTVSAVISVHRNHGN
jgi:hypothetical protein